MPLRAACDDSGGPVISP